jgi:hypothetical protein
MSPNTKPTVGGSDAFGRLRSPASESSASGLAAVHGQTTYDHTRREPDPRSPIVRPSHPIPALPVPEGA